MFLNLTVTCDEGSLMKERGGDDQAVEWISSPGQTEGSFDDIFKGIMRL